MFVWVYQSTQSDTVDATFFDTYSGNSVPIYDGQLLLQSESYNQRFYTWDRSRGEWATIETANPPISKTAYIPIYIGAQGFAHEPILRLDHFNCDQWDMCTTDGTWGSQYSIRNTINIYDGSGNFIQSLDSSKKLAFSGGYGFTNSSSLPSSPTGVGIRTSGYYWNGGWYPYGTNVRYASVNFTAHPLSYGINTA